MHRESNAIGIVAAIMNADEIQTYWPPLQAVRIYRRYKGREEGMHELAQVE